MKSIRLAATATLLLFALSAQANESLRCGGHLIEAGDTQPPTLKEVEKLCGKPDKRTGNVIEYHDKGMRLNFGPDGKLKSIHKIDDHDVDDDD